MNLIDRRRRRAHVIYRIFSTLEDRETHRLLLKIVTFVAIIFGFPAASLLFKGNDTAQYLIGWMGGTFTAAATILFTLM